MRSRPSLLALALALAVLAGCGAFNGLEVDVDRIEPAAATGLAPVAVQIDGAFAIDITSDLDNGKLGVAMVGVLIDDIPLTDVTWQSDQRIDGTIPAGLAPGLHDIVVTIGTRRGVLPGGFAITGASLVSTMTIPPMIGRDTSFTVTMTVTNIGTIAATAVAPSVLNTLGTGSAMLTTPAIGGASLAAGASTTFTWTYTALTVGTIAFTGNATATDELTALDIASPVSMSNPADIVEVTTVISDPLGDGTSFAYVVGYNGFVYLGPNETGNRTARMLPDFTFLLSNMTLTFARDVTGNQSSNAAATYTSIGYTGCTVNTSECGPDNEAGRGYFAAGMLGGTEWLVLGGAKPNGSVEYIYMTSDTDSVVDFRYVDLSSYLGAQTHGFSAAHFFNNRLYLGFPDSGGAKPYFLALETTPPAPGLDASGLDAIDLAGDAFPGFATTTPAMIDSFGDLNGLLYVANQAGLFAATVTTPGPYNNNPTDWALATPAFTEWANKTPVTTTKEADLFPADRAIPQMASFGGRLFFGRNTTTGPQLWSCNPAGSSSPTRCEPGDWQLAAPNIVGDVALTQFNNASLTSITMVVATPQWLYVGFDSSSGVQVFRTSNPAALLPADFEGLSGCAANMHPNNCQGIGGTGLGDPTDTRILDAKALTFSGASSVWITVGGTSGALRLVMIP